MEDKAIIALYLGRDEQAVTETSNKYGRFCMKIAMNILSDVYDSEECVNDTYHKAWSTIPPVIPQSLQAYIGKITRNISINMYRVKHARKRDCAATVLISELEECIPQEGRVEDMIEREHLKNILNEWLHGLKEEDCALFIRHYWSGDSLDDIASEWGVRANRLSVRLCRMRKNLKEYLSREGIMI